MAEILLRGTPVQTSGQLPAVGTIAPNATFVKNDMGEITLSELRPSRVILNIFPSVDTGICAASVRRFNVEAASLDNTQVLCVSADLPFALGRFCGSEGIENVQTVSVFRSDFPDTFGVRFIDSPMRGLCSRAVVVIAEDGTVLYSEQVPEIGQEPNYEAALAACKA